MGKGGESLLSNCTSDGLAGLLAGLSASGDKRLLVGYETSDDAAVYMLDEKHSLTFQAQNICPHGKDNSI